MLSSIFLLLSFASLYMALYDISDFLALGLDCSLFFVFIGYMGGLLPSLLDLHIHV